MEAVWTRRRNEAEKEGFEPSRQGFSPPNALAGRRLQPLGHFSASRHRIAQPSARYPMPSPEGWQSGRMRRSRKPFGAVSSREGSNPSPSAQSAAARSLAETGRLRGQTGVSTVRLASAAGHLG